MAETLISRGFRMAGLSGAGVRVDLIWPGESAWRLFETTGSVWAYLAYRRLTGWALVIARMSLN